MNRLDEKLREFAGRQPVSFHMPGHKGKNLELGRMEQYDITEIEGFDELYEPSGILKDLQDMLSGLYGSRRSYILTNGSTGANLAAVFAACSEGDAVIVDRSCHRSVHNAIEIRGLKASYTKSRPMAAVTAGEVESAITLTPQAKALVITSPTYEGMIADIERIAEICHSHAMALIVDAAHGAHFLRDTEWQEYAEALSCADLVVMSLHKTLPVLGQTACLHVYSDRISDDAVRHYIEVFHTSSPSYLMMAAASKCIGELYDRKKRKRLFDTYSRRLDDFCSRMRDLRHIRLWRADEHPGQLHDRGKLILMTDGGVGSGAALLRMLSERDVYLEMAGFDYALAMTSIADEDADFDRLYDALKEIDSVFEDGCSTVGRAGDTEQTICLPEAGSRADAMISIYPPGTPIVCRGEVIEERHLTEIRRALDAGLYVRGLVKHE